MNTKNLFAFDFSTSSIVASATTLKKARKPESPEYRVLTELLNAHPEFHVVEKDVQKKPGKKTYKGLTFQTMLDYTPVSNRSFSFVSSSMRLSLFAVLGGCFTIFVV